MTQTLEIGNVLKHDGIEKETDKTKTVQLEKTMTLFNSITMIVGSIIGAGIFVSPTGIIRNSGSIGMSLIVWTFCGVFSMIGAYCYTELGTCITESGADYSYILKAYGDFPAFMRMWIEIIIAKPALTAIVALTFSEYIVYPFFPCESEVYLLKIITVLITVLVGAINMYSVKISNRLQDVTTIGKSLALFLVIGLGIYMFAKGNVEYISDPFKYSIFSPFKLSLAVYYGLFSFNGWMYLNSIVEEMKNPVRDLPLAIFISCIFVLLVYLLTNICYFSVMDPATFHLQDGIAIFAIKIIGPIGVTMALFVAVSTLGSVNANILSCSRMIFVAARRGHTPEVVNMIHINHVTPFMSVAFTTIIATLLGLFANLDLLIKASGMVWWLAIGVSVSTIFVLRRKYPDLKRPIKIHLFWPIIFIFLTALILIMPFIESPYETGLGILMVFAGIPIYFIFISNPCKMKFGRYTAPFTRFFQKLFLIAVEKA